jgi:hypothetical protein
MTGNRQLLTSINNHECQLKEVEMLLSNICIGLNILVITEETIATLFAWVLKVWHLMC